MTNFFLRRKKARPPTDHPAYAVGEQLGRWWLRQERRVADGLNAWQSQVSSRTRNAVLLALFVLLATYFIRVFIQTI